MIAFFSNNGGEVLKDDWYIDSGATGHICNNKNFFESFVEGKTNKSILRANSNRVKVHGIGTVKLTIGEQSVTLKKVNYVLDMCTNLISVRRITESEFKVVFTQGRYQVIDSNRIVIIESRLLERMYKVKVKQDNELVCFSHIVDDSEKWHQKLGHPGYTSMKFLEKQDEKIVMPNEKYKVCILGKHAANHTMESEIEVMSRWI